MQKEPDAALEYGNINCNPWVSHSVLNQKWSSHEARDNLQ